MNISTTDFDFEHHFSKKAGNNTYGEYVYHAVTAFNRIKIDEVELYAVYQTGEFDIHNDYDCPSNELLLSKEGGTSDALLIINDLYQSDFEDQELMNETLEKLKKCCSVIDSIEKLQAVYDALNDNKPFLSQFLDAEKYTDDLDNYIEDREGFLSIKD